MELRSICGSRDLHSLPGARSGELCSKAVLSNGESQLALRFPPIQNAGIGVEYAERNGYKMKIGVALSGCDIGGVSAYHVLKLLEKKGFSIQMVSACCMPSVTALCHGCGLKKARTDRLAAQFLDNAGKQNLDAAIAAASDLLPGGKLARNKSLAINAVNIADGKVVTFTNGFSLDTGTLKTVPLDDAYDALSSTINMLDGLRSYQYNGLKLCDFSVWYGCPLYPLKMGGISRTISIAFLPKEPKTPYEILVRQGTLANCRSAGLHISIEFPAGLTTLADYEEIASCKIESCMNDLYWDAAFGPAGKLVSRQ